MLGVFRTVYVKYLQQRKYLQRRKYLQPCKYLQRCKGSPFKIHVTSIHSKSEKVCGFYFSIEKNQRKKCVNRDDDKSAFINQKSKKCIIWTSNVKANQEVCLLWLHFLQNFSTHFGLGGCLFTFISNILQNWYFSLSQTIFLRKIPNCLRILESSESSF